MKEAPELNARERQILHAVVHSYITTAEPVGSRALVKRFELDVSPATVRNVMADLEEAGYLKQLHTSSGRVPTDAGYLYYVNYLMRVQQLTQHERAQIEQEFTAKLNDADAVLRQTSQLLALVSHQAGLAEAPGERVAIVNRIELLPVSERRMAVLVVDNFGRVRSVSVDVDSSFDEDLLSRVNRFLNEQLVGARADNLAEAVQNRLRGFLDEQRRLAEQALRVLNLVPKNPPAQLYLDGARQLFEQPEFRDLSRAREVFDLFEERDRLVGMLRRAVQENEPIRGSVIIAGDEGLEGISVIVSPYEVDGERAGMIGVLGPRRMPYPRLTAVVDYTASMVGKVLSRLGK